MNDASIWDSLELPAVPEAETLAENFLHKRGGRLRVDAGGVARISVPCLQVMISAAATWAADKVPFEFINGSTTLQEELQTLGIDPALLGMMLA